MSEDSENEVQHVGGFTINSEHCMGAECPVCEKYVTLYHLGGVGGQEHPTIGWVCGKCESEVLEVWSDDNEWSLEAASDE